MKHLVAQKIFLFTVLLLLSGGFTWAQINGNQFIATLEGGFSSGPASGALAQMDADRSYGKVKSWDAGVSIGYIHNNWIWGAGFTYASYKTQSTEYIATSMWGQDVDVESSSKLPSGNVFAGYYLPLYRNLYFKPALYCSYGKITYNPYSISYLSPNYPIYPSYPDDVDTPPGIHFVDKNTIKYEDYYELSEDKNTVDYLGFRLSAEFTYFFSQHFGCNLQLGGAKVDVIDNHWSKKQTIVSFDPKYWRVGFVFGF